MITYLYQVTEALLMCAALTGIVFAYARERWGSSGVRVVGAGCAAGWLAATVIAVLKSTTKLIDSGLWNLRFVGAYLVGLLLLVIPAIPALARALGARAELARQVGAALVLLGVTGYLAPEPLAYPATIITLVETIVSTDFFFRMVGWVAGLVLMVLTALAAYQVLSSLDTRTIGVLTALACAICGLELSGLALRALLTRRIIAQSTTAFQVAVLASNNALVVGCIVAGLALVAACLLLARSLRVSEPYANAAQHRKIRAKWRRRRRWAVCAAVCVACALLNVTVAKAYDSREVELSPSEECELRDDGCYIPLTQVDDGHLHRFTYESPDGVGIRFIVIKKPGGSAYGIGLDACDICGETGYYERDGQVVCKLCDVVMNVQTIGFKGGCNPIVIDYAIKDGYIIVPYDTLLEHEVIFTR